MQNPTWGNILSASALEGRNEQARAACRTEHAHGMQELRDDLRGMDPHEKLTTLAQLFHGDFGTQADLRMRTVLGTSEEILAERLLNQIDNDGRRRCDAIGRR